MEKKVIGLGFIGSGEISILHGRAVKEISNARLVGLWNRTRKTGEERAKEEGCRFYESPQALVDDPEIDAVHILTNLETHLEFAKLAMEAGKDVLIEKPVCATVPEIHQLREIAGKTGRLCIPGHNMIHESSLARTKKLMSNGDLGDLVSCYVMYNIFHNQERTSTLPGVIRQLLTHNLYTLMYVTNQRPVKVMAMKSNRSHPAQKEKEDIAMVLIQLESGGLAHLNVSYAADDLSPAPWTYTMKLIGTAGTAHYTYQDWVEVKKGISHSHTYTAYQDTITSEIGAFIDLVRNGEGEFLSTIDDALWAQKTLEAVEVSISTGRIVEIQPD